MPNNTKLPHTINSTPELINFVNNMKHPLVIGKYLDKCDILSYEDLTVSLKLVQGLSSWKVAAVEEKFHKWGFTLAWNGLEGVATQKNFVESISKEIDCLGKFAIKQITGAED